MKRTTFIKTLAAGAGMVALSSLKGLADSLPEQDEKMPVLFIGHGSPMNALEDNEFTRAWQHIAKGIKRPQAILFVSAHWLTKGTFVTGMQNPQTIHDFGGFPAELFDTQYNAPGNPELAKDIALGFTQTKVGLDYDWGLDHGTWSVAKPMYPAADIPVLQLSIDYYKPAQYHYELAKQLGALRKKGVLIIGSGNMVHNLSMPNFSMLDTGYDWAIEMNEVFKKHILDGNHKALMEYETLNKAAKLAVPTPDHYFPMLYSLGLQERGDAITLFNDKAVLGSITMTSIKIG